MGRGDEPLPPKGKWYLEVIFQLKNPAARTRADITERDFGEDGVNCPGQGRVGKSEILCTFSIPLPSFLTSCHAL